MRHQRFAFTVIELLVVLAIIGVLVSLLIPAVQAARAAARLTDCQNRTRQLALAVHLHVDSHQTYPVGQMFGPFGVGPGSTAWSWMARILPYVERRDLYDQGRVPIAELYASEIADQQVGAFLCPSDGFSFAGPRTDRGDFHGIALGLTNFKAVNGANWGHDSSQNLTDIGTAWPNPGTNGSQDGQDNGDGILFRTDYRRRGTPAIVQDGLSNTLMIGEDLPEKNLWCSWPYATHAYGTCAIPLNVKATPGGSYDPIWWPNVAGFRSNHTGGGNFAFADGSVRLISDSIDLATYRALATIRGGELVSADAF